MGFFLKPRNILHLLLSIGVASAICWTSGADWRFQGQGLDLPLAWLLFCIHGGSRLLRTGWAYLRQGAQATDVLMADFLGFLTIASFTAVVATQHDISWRLSAASAAVGVVYFLLLRHEELAKDAIKKEILEAGPLRSNDGRDIEG